MTPIALRIALSLPGIAIDDAECGDDRHADEARQCHDDPAVREALTDNRRQEQRLAGGGAVVDVVVSLAQVHRTRHTLDKPGTVRQLRRAAQQEHPNIHTYVHTFVTSVNEVM